MSPFTWRVAPAGLNYNVPTWLSSVAACLFKPLSVPISLRPRPSPAVTDQCCSAVGIVYVGVDGHGMITNDGPRCPIAPRDVVVGPVWNKRRLTVASDLVMCGYSVWVMQKKTCAVSGLLERRRSATLPLIPASR
jgi:hypothetical protein